MKERVKVFSVHLNQLIVGCVLKRMNKVCKAKYKNKCVSGNGSENVR